MLRGWVCGSGVPSPGAGRSWKAAAESRLGLGALEGRGLLLDPSLGQSAIRIPLSTAVRCYWISARDPKGKRLKELTAREREKFRNMAQPPYFILLKMGQLRPPEGGDQLKAVLRNSSGLQASTLTSGAALTAPFSSQHYLTPRDFVSPFGSWKIPKNLLISETSAVGREAANFLTQGTK